MARPSGSLSRCQSLRPLRVCEQSSSALGIGIAVFTLLTGVWQIVAAVVAAILLLTGLVGFCPIYALLRISSRGRTTHATISR